MLRRRDMMFLLGILWATTLPPGYASSQRVAADEVPDLVLVYPMQKYPGQVEAYCTGSADLQLQMIKVPEQDFFSKYPSIDGTDKIKLVWEEDNLPANDKARGLICYDSSQPNYNVTVPLMDSKSDYVPKQLSYTVSQGEDLVLDFEKCDHENVLVHKEPVKTNWIPLSLNNSSLFMSSENINGSGLYSVTKYESPPGNQKEVYGTVAILSRDCPDSRYGNDCRMWCPDCQYGGACHPRTGKCVCPPGQTGDRCQTPCKNSKIGRNCTIDLPFQSRSGFQICLPFPYGCSCAPGYSGFKCETGCADGFWGVNCLYSCNHCTDNNCDRLTGECRNPNRVDSCAGGELGLPRLRQKPQINSWEDSAQVRFTQWDPKSDDGDLPSSSNITGYQVIVKEMNV